MLLLALQEHPDYVLASFDLGGRTFRHEELAQYKATRRPTPPELSPQFPLTRDIVRAFGIPIYEVQGVEADDVIGTLATQARELGLHSTIVTGDLDALQLVNDDVDVLTSKRGVSETILYTPARARERYGLEPIQTVDLKGLDRLNAVALAHPDRKSTRLHSSHSQISYAVFCLLHRK